MGLRGVKKNYKKLEHYRRAIVAGYEAGVSMAAIGKSLDITRERVRQLINELGITWERVIHCVGCGKFFYTRHSIGVYCSEKCHRKVAAAVQKVDHPEKSCLHCGATFKPKNINGRHCSKRCQNIANVTRYQKANRSKINKQCRQRYRKRKAALKAQQKCS